MFAGAFFGLVAWLYYLCFLLLIGLMAVVALHGRRLKGSKRTPARPALRRTFLWLALALLLWQFTLYLEVRATLPAIQFWLGRLNFTAIVFAPFLALRFVQEISSKKIPQRETPRWQWLNFWLRAETGMLAGLTLLTPLVCAAERVMDGYAITTFGPLFPGYLLHVMGYLMAALVMALRERRRCASPRVRCQLTLIAAGMLTTGGIAFITNALLPYARGDFRFGHVGTLSTFGFLVAVAYATFVHRLFGLRVVLRETLVYGLLLAFVLGAYSSAVFVVSQYLTEGAGKMVQFAVLLIAFSLDPLRRFLEEKTDRLLFGRHGGEGGEGRADESKRRGRGRQGRSPLRLALLFPWRRP